MNVIQLVEKLFRVKWEANFNNVELPFKHISEHGESV